MTVKPPGLPRVSLGDLAAAAGVSRATVSRALRNNPLISRSQRERIQALADRMGYRPDPEASRLLAHLRRAKAKPFLSVLGLLNAHRESLTRVPSSYTQRLVSGARARAHELGYQLDEFSLVEPGMTPRRLSQILHARSVSGLLIPPEPEPLFAVNLDWSNLAAVATTTTAPELPLHRVLPHHHFNVRVLLEAALALGYRRIGLVACPGLEERQEHAATATYAWFAHIAGRIPPLPVCVWDWKQPEAMGERLAAWFQQSTPDLVLGFGPTVLAALSAQTGLRAPDDFGFISSSGESSDLSRLEENPEKIGAAAIEMISSNLHRGELGLPATPKTTLIEGRFIPAGTTRRKPGPGSCR